MKTFLLAFFVMGLGCAVSGCNGVFGCTEVGCSDGASVSLLGMAEKYAGSSPLTVKMCVDGSTCVTAHVILASGALSCKIVEDISMPCTINTNTKDVNIAVLLDGKLSEKEQVTLSVLVTDGANAKLFEGDKSVELTDSQPNGAGCDPICRQGSVSFTP